MSSSASRVNLAVPFAGGVAVLLMYIAYSSTQSKSLSRPGAPMHLRHEAAEAPLAFLPGSGLFYASNMSSPARFRIVDVSQPMVLELYEQAQLQDRAAMQLRLGGIKVTTRSNCTCTGFSNEHGYGRYCYPWEDQYQDPWCYVPETCGRRRTEDTGRRGSFGRKFEPCTQAPPPPSPPMPPPPPLPPSLPFASPPPNNIAPPGFVWAAPDGCSCSGFSNRHGFGRQCRAWESHLPGAEQQVPWCYVREGCAVATRTRGSFGKLYAECVATPPAAAASGGAAASSGLIGALKRIGRRLSLDDSTAAEAARSAPRPSTRGSGGGGKGAVAGPSPPHAAAKPHRIYAKYRKGTSRAYAIELDTSGEKLVQRLARFSPRYVALLHEDTHNYLTVERPPHGLALKAHALSSHLSVGSIFALIRAPRKASKLLSAYVPASSLTHTERRAAFRSARAASRQHLVVSMGAAAYLTLCPDHPPGDTGGLSSTNRLEGAMLCAGHRPEKRWAEPLKLLRKPSVPTAPAVFELVPAASA